MLHDRAGSGNPLGLSGNSDRLPFAPYYIFKDLITIFVFILVLSIFVFYMPNILGDSENYVMANPMQTPPAIVPEWYLLPFYAILRSIPNKLLGVIAMFSAILMLLAMPFADLSRSRGIQFKPLSKIVFFFFVGNFLALTQLGAEHVESPFIEFGQICTILYFAYFLIIIPYVCLFENSLSVLWLEWYFSEKKHEDAIYQYEHKDVLKYLTGKVYNNIGKRENEEYVVPTYAVAKSFFAGSLLFSANDNNEDINNWDDPGADADDELDDSMEDILDELDDNMEDILYENPEESLYEESEQPENYEDSDDDWETIEQVSDGLITDEDDDEELDDYNQERERHIQKWRDERDQLKNKGNNNGNNDDNNNNNSNNTRIINIFYITMCTILLPGAIIYHFLGGCFPLYEESLTIIDCFPQPEENLITISCLPLPIEDLFTYLSKNYILPVCMCDAPRPWGMYFQDSGTPQMEALVELHDNIMFYLVIILFGVGWLLITIINKFGGMASPISQKFASHGTTVEIIWTVTPGIILILIAFPSFKLLFLMDEVSDPAMVILAEGHQWYWSYDYIDFINNDDEFIEFDSYLVPEPDLQDGALRMLEVDNRLIIPELTHVRFVVAGADVIHSFACPALGLKCDAYPGRLNQSSLMINRPSTFYGQCSEICGILHSSMPIVIESVSVEKFIKWLVQQ